MEKSLEHISATSLSQSPLHTHCRPIVPMDYMGDEYFTLKPLVIKYERRLLKVQAYNNHIYRQPT